MTTSRAVESDTYVCLSEHVRISYEIDTDRSVQLDFRGRGDDGLTLSFSEAAFGELTRAVGRSNAELLRPPS